MKRRVPIPAIASHIDEYQQHLESAGMSTRTIDSYLWVARFFDEKYGEPQGDALAAYRSWLVGTYKPNTVNQRVQAINCYLSFLGREDLRLETVRVERTDEGSAIDYAAYRRLVRHLRDGGYRRDSTRCVCWPPRTCAWASCSACGLRR
jgi:hypothetical protein